MHHDSYHLYNNLCVISLFSVAMHLDLLFDRDALRQQELVNVASLVTL